MSTPLGINEIPKPGDIYVGFLKTGKCQGHTFMLKRWIDSSPHVLTFEAAELTHEFSVTKACQSCKSDSCRSNKCLYHEQTRRFIHGNKVPVGRWGQTIYHNMYQPSDNFECTMSGIKVKSGWYHVKSVCA